MWPAITPVPAPTRNEWPASQDDYEDHLVSAYRPIPGRIRKEGAFYVPHC